MKYGALAPEGEDQPVEHRKYPEPLSLCWRLTHYLNYQTGGVTFLIGSYNYYPDGNVWTGAWMFLIGGTAFLFADIWEWWMNNRVG